MTTKIVKAKPSRVDFDRMDINQIQRILSTGSLDNLTPQEREYFSLMEMVRGLRARMKANGRVVTKAGIIRLLKSEAYGLSDWQARQVYADAVNFFYDTDDIRPRAFANLYAEKAENLSMACAAVGKMADARAYLKLAADLRGCFNEQEQAIPEELLAQRPVVIYTTEAEDMGVPATDRKRLEEFIDAIPDVPMAVRENVKEDARIKKFDLKRRMLYDIKEFSEPEDQGSGE